MIDRYIQQYGRRLYGLCCTLCANSVDADDLYQETWLKVCRKIERYNPSKPFEAWLTGICVNTYRDLLRGRRLRPVFNGFATNEEKDRALESVPENEREDYAELHAAVDRLPPKMRITVILHYFHDLDEKATAASLGVPVGTVKSRLNKAKKQLKEELKNEPDLQL